MPGDRRRETLFPQCRSQPVPDRLCLLCRQNRERGTSLSTSEQVNKEHLPEVMAAVRKEKTPVVQPKRMRVTYTLTVDSNAVPAGK